MPCAPPVFAAAVAGSTAEASGPPAEDSLFAPLDGFDLGRSDDVRVRPAAFHASRVDLEGLQDALRGGGTRQVTIPDPAGTPTTFHVVEDSVMEPALQAAHPDMRTYSGSGPGGQQHPARRHADGLPRVRPAPRRPGLVRRPGAEPRRAKTGCSATSVLAVPANKAFVEREVKAVTASGSLS